MTAILTFDTTHHALWAEQLARQDGLAVQVVHAPPEAAARCDIALEVDPADIDALQRTLRDSAVPFRRHR